MAATITVVCPYCKNRMRAAAEHVGRQGRCPICKNLVEIVPAADEHVPTLEPTRSGLRGPARRPAAAATEVNTWIAGCIAAAVTVALYLAIFLPIYKSGVGGRLGDVAALFAGRGPIPFVIVLLTCWGATTLVLKYVAVRRQMSYAELELELIPLEIGLQITPSNVDQFLDHLGRLPADQQQSILARRIQGALEHFKHRNSVPEVQQYLASEAELEAAKVDSGYVLLRAFIWAIPILGFIGTVMGIGQAVGELGHSLEQPPAAETESPDPLAMPDLTGEQPPGHQDPAAKLMSGMKQVVGGLSVAFDTTFIALIMAVLLLFPTESLRKAEYAMLNRIEEFANESLLRRMAERRDELPDEMPQIVRNALESAFQEHQRWLAQWQAQVAELGQAIGAEFETSVMTLHDKLSQNYKRTIGEIRNATQAVQELFKTTSGQIAEWQSTASAASADIKSAAEAASRLQELLAQNIQLLMRLLEQQQRAAEQYARVNVAEQMRQLNEQIGRLADRIGPSDGDKTLEPVSKEERHGLLGRIWSRRS